MVLALGAFLTESRHHQQPEVDGQPETERRCDSERVHRHIGDADHDRQHQQCHDDRRDADGQGQEGGNETAENNDEHGEQDGQRDALADDEIVIDPVLDLHRHAQGAACAHFDGGIDRWAACR